MQCDNRLAGLSTMARQKRLNLPGAVYHLITRGLNGAALFKDNQDRKEIIRRLAESLGTAKCLCYAWVLMNNHIHLLVRASEKPLSEFARILLTGYAIYFNRRHKRRGYLYQNRYKSILCQEDCYLLELVRYIHLNPVRAGIVKTINELDVYPWSGHAALTGRKPHTWQSTGEIMALFGQDKNKAKRAYRQFIEDGWSLGKQDELVGGGIKRGAAGWDGPKGRRDYQVVWRGDEMILGDNAFIARVLRLAEEAAVKREEFKRRGWTLDRLARQVCSLLSINCEDLKKRGRVNEITFARGLFAFWGIMLGIKWDGLGALFKYNPAVIDQLDEKRGSSSRRSGLKTNKLTPSPKHTGFRRVLHFKLECGGESK